MTEWSRPFIPVTGPRCSPEVLQREAVLLGLSLFDGKPECSVSFPACSIGGCQDHNKSNGI